MKDHLLLQKNGKLYAFFRQSQTYCRKSKSYYCTVENEQGEEQELSVSKKDYRALKQGDRVRYYDGEGALGVYYTFFLEEIP